MRPIHASDHPGHVIQTALSDAAAEAALTLYAVAVAAALAVLAVTVCAARRFTGVRSAPAATSVHDPYEAAFLGGGPGRAVDAALTALHEDGRLAVADPGVVGVRPGAVARHPVEGAVLAAYAGAPSGALHWLRAAAMRAPAVQALGDGLAARGLLVPPAPLGVWRRRVFAYMLVCLAGLPLAGVLWATSDAEAPVDPFLVALVMVPGVWAGILCSRVAADRTTRSGRLALRLYRRRTRDESSAPREVAVRGLRGVRDTALRQRLAQARRDRVGGPPTVSATAPPTHHTYDADWSGEATVWCAGGEGCGGSSCGAAHRDGEGGRSGCGSGGSGCGGGGGCGSSCGGGCGGGGGGGD
ncbi:TIGR04222 domain-containing membrane protein [Streptomyces sp. G45]|uniref:TIGR04222 domain-containing membrane protein n=1 Tax=Streptomyces sp. G45 TaxID=3406627 RepID=UPI003C1A02E9